MMMMKTLALLCLVVLLPCVWTRSLQEEDESFDEQEDKVSTRTLSGEEMNQFIKKASKGFKKMFEEMSDDKSSASKRFISLGHGFSLGKTLSWKSGNYGVHLKPIFHTYSGKKKLDGARLYFKYSW